MSDNIAKGLRSVVDDREFAAGKEADIQISAGTSVAIGSVTFSSDAIGGDPAFSAVPFLLHGIERSSSGAHPDESVSVEFHSVTTTGFSYIVRVAQNVSFTKYLTLHWLAVKL